MDNVNLNSNVIRKISQSQQNLNLDDIEEMLTTGIAKENSESIYQTIPNTNIDTVSPSTLTKVANFISDARNAIFGIGLATSEVLKNELPIKITPKKSIFARNIARFGGGILNAITLAPSVYDAYKQDKTNGNNNYLNTQKEIVSGLGSIGAGAIAGKIGSIGISALAGLGAGPVVLLGAGVAVAGGIIYATYKTKEFIENKFDIRNY